MNGLIDSLAPTNSLKANLKDKLSAIYSQTSIADFVSVKSNASRVQALGEAIGERKKVFLRGYESGHSHSIRDRYVKPFGFTTDYADVCALDLEAWLCTCFTTLFRCTKIFTFWVHKKYFVKS